jgi:hypothetical protein
MQQESHNTPENPQEHDLQAIVRNAEEEGRKDYERTQKLFENPMGIEPPTLLTEDEEREPLREEIDVERFHLAFKDAWEYMEGNKDELALRAAEYALNEFNQGDNTGAAEGLHTLSALTELGLLHTLPEEKQKEFLTLAKKRAPDAAEYAINEFKQGDNTGAAYGIWPLSALTKLGLLHTLPEEKQEELLTLAKKRAPDAAEYALTCFKQGDNWRAALGLRTLSALTERGLLHTLPEEKQEELLTVAKESAPEAAEDALTCFKQGENLGAAWGLWTLSAEEVIYKYLSEHAKKARGAEEAREAQTLERKKKLPPIPPTREF